MKARIALIMIAALTLPPLQGRGETQQPLLTPGDDSRHVIQLLAPAEAPLRSCLDSEAPEDEALPERVLARLEFPSGAPPRVITLDAWPGSVVDRCIRRALASINTPSYEGSLERHECLIPIGQGSLRCRPHPSSRSESSPTPEGEPALESPDEEQTATTEETADAQTQPSAPRQRRNSFTVNPLGVVMGGVDLKFTRALGRISIGAAVAIHLPLRLDGLGMAGFLEVLGWTGDRPLSGFYGGAAIQVGGTISPPGVIHVGPLAVIGLRWVFESGFTLGVGGSIGYLFFFADCPPACTAQTVNGSMRLDEAGRGGAFAARLVVDLGITF